MDKIMAIIKPFINKEMFQKVTRSFFPDILHFINIFCNAFQLIIHTNVDNLYNYIPKEAMPVDYGGKAESVDIQYGEHQPKTFSLS